MTPEQSREITRRALALWRERNPDVHQLESRDTAERYLDVVQEVIDSGEVLLTDDNNAIPAGTVGQP